MRIAYFVPRCTPDNAHGRYVVELARRYATAHAVTVHAGSIEPALGSVVRYVPVHVPLRPVVARLGVFWAAASILARRGRWDIVHVQGADVPVGNVVTAHYCNAAAARLLRPRGPTRWLNHRLAVAAERHCYGRAQVRRVIAVSRAVADEVHREYGVPAGRISVVYNGVDGEHFHPRNRAVLRQSARQELGLDAGQFCILFVGADYRRKGLLTLLEAVAGLRGLVRVVAVGVTQNGSLRAAISASRQPVTCIPHVRDMRSFYAAVDCFVLPTVYDTFSLATLEAMAAGLPVVVSRTAGVAELLTPGADALLLDNPRDAAALAAILEPLIHDSVLRNRLGHAARCTAERLSWDAMAAKVFEIYQGVASIPH